MGRIMENQHQIMYEFSDFELWYLFSLMSPSAVIGFRNPVAGMLLEDMFPIVQEVSYSLLDRDLIYVDVVGGEIRIRDPLSLFIKAVAAPQHTILLGHKLEDSEKEKIRSINFRNNNIIVLDEHVNGLFRLDVVASNDVLSSILEPFVDRVFWAPDSDRFLIPQDDLVLIHDRVKAGAIDQAEAVLLSTTGDDRSKKHFLDTVQRAPVRFSLVAFLDRDKPRSKRVDGFSIVAGEQYIWLMEIVDEEQKVVSVSKISLKDLNKKIQSFLVTMLGG